MALDQSPISGLHKKFSMPDVLRNWNYRTRAYRAVSRPKNILQLFLCLYKYPTGWFKYQGNLYCFTGWKKANDRPIECGQMLAKIPTISRFCPSDILLCCQAPGWKVDRYRRGDWFAPANLGKLSNVRWIVALVSFLRVYQAVKKTI